MAGESYKSAIEQAKKDIKEIETGIKGLSTAVGGIDAAVIKKLNETFAKSPQKLQAQITTLEAEMKKLTIAMNKQKKAANELSVAKKAQQKLIGFERENNQYLNKNVREQAILHSNLAGEYDKLKVKRDQALKNLRNLAANEKASGQAVKEAATKYQYYAAQLEKVKNIEIAAANAKKNKAAREKAISKEISKNVQRHIADMTKQSDIQKRLSADYKEWERTAAREAAVRKKAEEAAKLQANAYNQLKAKFKEAQEVLRTLLATENANAQAVKQAQLAYQHYGAELDKIKQKERDLANEKRDKLAREKRQSQEISKNVQRHIADMTKQSQIQKDMSKYYRELEVSSARDAKAKERQAAATAKLNRAYVQLETKQRQARDTLRDLIASQTASTTQIKRAQREFDKYTKRLNQARQATSNFNKTSLGGMVRGVNNLMAAFGIAGGVYLFADIIKQGFNLAKQLDAIDFAMKTVITDTRELARSKAFLTQITDDYGAAIVTTTERYNKFIAAAKQSNVSLSDTELIFGTMTKAAGALGLRSHELEGVFLALEQMLSKGKVTTEELRRQLGERLPGAFGIMAKAVDKLNPDVDITVSMLDKMLKKGEVLSAEVLPEFARQVELAYGLNTLTRVENLNAATTRLSNAWVKLVQDFTKAEGPINKVLVKTIDELAKRLADVSEGFSQINHELNVGKNSWERFLSFMRSLSSESKAVQGALDTVYNTLLILKALLSIKIWDVWAVLIKGLVTTFSSFAVAIEKAYDELRDFTELLKDPLSIKDAWDRVANEFTSTWTRAYGDVKLGMWKLGDEIDIFVEKYGSLAPLAPDHEGWDFTKMGEGVGELKDKIEELKEEAEEPIVLAGSAAAIQAEISRLEDLKERLATTNAEREKYNDQIREQQELLRELINLPGTVNAIEAEIAALKDLIDSQALSNEEREETIKLIKEQEEFLRRLIEGEKELSEIKNADIDLFDSDEERFEKQKELLDREVEENRRAQQAIQAIRTGSMEHAIDLTDAQYEMIEAAIEAEKELRTQVGEEIQAAAIAGFESIFDRRVEVMEREIEANKDYYAEILNNEELSEEQRDSIEAERDAKERRLEKKKRKREKEAFLAKKGMAIAEIGIELAKQIALINTTATAIDSITFGIGGPIYRAANIPLAVGVAAAQAAAVVASAIPQFAKGTDDAPEGIALVDEVTPEVHTDKYGNVKSYGKNKPNYRMLEKGDKIYRNRGEYRRKLNQEKRGLESAILDMNMNSQGRELSQVEVDNALLASGLQRLEKSNDRMWSEVKKLASRPVHVNNTIELQDNRHY